MDSFDVVEHTEASEVISIDGDEAVVHHARAPDLDQQEFATYIHELSQEHDFEEPDKSAARLLKHVPETAQRVHKLTRTDFTMLLHDDDSLSVDVELAGSDSFSYFPFDPDKWENANYPTEDATTAEVIAAFLSLVNASWCVNHLENTLEEEGGEDSEMLFSEDYFNVQVTQGLLLAFREAFLTHSPKASLQGMYFHDNDRAIIDAVQNALGITLTEPMLHGLLLADWNQSVKLQSASEYGRKRSVEEGINALEGLTNAMQSDESP